MKELVSKEVATAEVNSWLDRMDITADNRVKEGVKPYVDGLIRDVMFGLLIFNDNETVTQRLKYPLGDGNTTEIVYDFRYEIGEYNKATKGIFLEHEIDWTMARLVLVNEKKYPKSVFEKMKGADYNVAKKLAVFF